MAAIVWTDVLALPGADTDDLASVPMGGQTMILAVVNSIVMLDPTQFDGEAGPLTKLARCLLAAHAASLSAQGGNGKATGQSEGGVSESFAAPTFDHGSWPFTSYGVLLQSLINPGAYAVMVL